MTRIKLKHAFDTIDEDHSGELDMEELDMWFRKAKTKPSLSLHDIEAAKSEIDADHSGTVGFDELWQWWRKQDPPLKLRALEDEDTTEDEEDEISSDDEEGGFRGATSSLFTGLTGGEFGSGKHRAKLAAQLKRAELAVHDSRTLDRLTKGKFGHGEHRKKLLRDFQTLLGKQSHKEAIAVEEKAHAARQDAGEIVADDLTTPRGT